MNAQDAPRLNSHRDINNTIRLHPRRKNFCSLRAGANSIIKQTLNKSSTRSRTKRRISPVCLYICHIFFLVGELKKNNRRSCCNSSSVLVSAHLNSLKLLENKPFPLIMSRSRSGIEET